VSGQTVYAYTGNDPLDKTDPTGNGQDFMYSSADMSAMGTMAQLRAAEDAGRAEAVSYPNRQVVLKSFAATTAVYSAGEALTGFGLPAAAATGIMSAAASGVALFDQKVTTGHFDWFDFFVNLTAGLKLAKGAAALTGLADVGKAVNAGREGLHAGSAVLGAELAYGEKRLDVTGAAIQSAANATAAAKGYDSVKVNSNGTATGTHTPIGSRISHSTTCDAQGHCTSN
jgi:hypothetical protein